MNWMKKIFKRCEHDWAYSISTSLEGGDKVPFELLNEDVKKTYKNTEHYTKDTIEYRFTRFIVKGYCIKCLKTQTVAEFKDNNAKVSAQLLLQALQKRF